jgi:anti-sigma regulatory factor (Ser/Thr protein kinase)
MLAGSRTALVAAGCAGRGDTSTARQEDVPIAAYCPSTSSVRSDSQHLEAVIGADPGEIAPIREAVHELAERAGYAARADDLALAINELIANAQEHGAAPIHVVAAADSTDGVHVEVRDSGCGFDWTEAVREHPPAPDSRRGRGLWIVRQLVDKVTVEQSGDNASTRIRIDVNQAA